jgi:hypothetical protein
LDTNVQWSNPQGERVEWTIARTPMPSTQLPLSIKFHYLKGSFFRVIHVDGAIGGLTPSRDVFVSLFSQRAALPRMIELAVLPAGGLGGEISREGKEGIVREMEVGIVMSANAAHDLATFLLEQVKAINESTPEGRGESISIEKEK